MSSSFKSGVSTSLALSRGLISCPSLLRQVFSTNGSGSTSTFAFGLGRGGLNHSAVGCGTGTLLTSSHSPCSIGRSLTYLSYRSRLLGIQCPFFTASVCICSPTTAPWGHLICILSCLVRTGKVKYAGLVIIAASEWQSKRHCSNRYWESRVLHCWPEGFARSGATNCKT
ncbi:hypothetical protein F5Y00DRAFT_155938, partial [Daldinia vernicosa]|uniref:uncharacterized protein n=1 Tax=Daldinia vernicosa TaxID=114800 RepID=UPI002007E9E2